MSPERHQHALMRLAHWQRATARQRATTRQRATARLRVALGAGVLAAAALGCNAAIGGGVVALAGGAGILAAQCYDQVRIRVRDDRGTRLCDAHVTLSSDGSERSLRPCYHASLTDGRHRLRAEQPGYLPAETEIHIPQRDGACPHYTRTVELTLRRPGERLPTPTFNTNPPPPAPPATPVTEPPPAATEPQPPTAEFPLLPAAPPSPNPPPPAPAPSPAPAPPPSPAPAPAPLPAPAPSPAPAPAPAPSPSPPPSSPPPAPAPAPTGP